jgi:hypothetical protein
MTHISYIENPIQSTPDLTTVSLSINSWGLVRTRLNNSSVHLDKTCKRGALKNVWKNLCLGQMFIETLCPRNVRLAGIIIQFVILAWRKGANVIVEELGVFLRGNKVKRAIFVVGVGELFWEISAILSWDWLIKFWKKLNSLRNLWDKTPGYRFQNPFTHPLECWLIVLSELTHRLCMMSAAKFSLFCVAQNNVAN